MKALHALLPPLLLLQLAGEVHGAPFFFHIAGYDKTKVRAHRSAGNGARGPLSSPPVQLLFWVCPP